MSEARSFDPWVPLSTNAIDPLYFRGEEICEDPSPCRQFFCTRENEHEGLHVASYSGGRVCCDAWGLHRLSQRLPEGF